MRRRGVTMTQDAEVDRRSSVGAGRGRHPNRLRDRTRGRTSSPVRRAIAPPRPRSSTWMEEPVLGAEAGDGAAYGVQVPPDDGSVINVAQDENYSRVGEASQDESTAYQEGAQPTRTAGTGRTAPLRIACRVGIPTWRRLAASQPGRRRPPADRRRPRRGHLRRTRGVRCTQASVP